VSCILRVFVTVVNHSVRRTQNYSCLRFDSSILFLDDSQLHAGQQVVRVVNAPRPEFWPKAKTCGSTWQGQGASPFPLHPFPHAASGGNGNPAGFHIFRLALRRGGAAVTANDNWSSAARRSGSQKRQRTRNISVPVDDDEFALIDAKARVAGMRRGSFGRACMLGDAGPRAQRAPTVNAEALALATAALNKVGSNLNQMARILNSGGITVMSGECFAVLADVRSAVVSILDIVGRTRGHDRQGNTPQ